MKKLLIPSLAIMACSLPLTSWAGSDSGIYIGGSVGQSAIDAEYDDYDYDEDATGYKVLIGYNFGVVPLFDLAVEADYRDFGSFEDKGAGIKSDATAIDVYGVAGLNFGPIGIFGKVGYTDTDVDAATEDGNINISDSSTTYGAGAKLHLGSFAIRAEYEVFDLDDLEDLSMWSIGATVTF